MVPPREGEKKNHCTYVPKRTDLGKHSETWKDLSRKKKVELSFGTKIFKYYLQKKKAYVKKGWNEILLHSLIPIKDGQVHAYFNTEHVVKEDKDAIQRTIWMSFEPLR